MRPLLLTLLLACGQASETPSTTSPSTTTHATTTQYAASHILIGYAGAKGAIATRSKAQARELANTIAKRALSGESFSALARAHSEGPSGRRGGDLGVFGPTTMNVDFQAAVASTQPGEIAPITETEFGFHIVLRNRVPPSDTKY